MDTRDFQHSKDNVTLADRTFDEKRNFIRMRMDTMITYTYLNKTERYDGRCINLSGAGMLLQTDKKLKVGDKLELIVPSDTAEFSSLNASAEVMRVSALPDQHKFEVGVIIKRIRG
ncbi:MAG: PilZ domain-containing protein [Pseudomonadales bacterium]|nr:PilZ domain-containing protein [Pseudomonadales bacterium]